MQASPEAQIPITGDGFMKPPAPVHSGVDATWLPEEIDLIDWVSESQEEEGGK